VGSCDGFFRGKDIVMEMEWAKKIEEKGNY